MNATTLWEYPSQHYDAFVDESGRVVRANKAMQGDKDYVGATPSWVIWQLLMRYTRPGDTILDPMCGSGTTFDVCQDLGRRGAAFDVSPRRPEITKADARKLPLKDESVDFVFVDPPYSTHVDYSDSPECIGKLDASPDSPDGGLAYYQSMARVFAEIDRVLKPRRYMALYVSDSWRKRKKTKERGGEERASSETNAGQGAGVFSPIGFELFSGLCELFTPIDIVCVVRQNAKLSKGNWRKAAEEGNFFLRGFNYLFIMKKMGDAG